MIGTLPNTNLPTNNDGLLPRAVKTAPTKKKILFAKQVHLLPFNSEGLLPIKHPIQAPTTMREVAN
jgi:hypothetical protein